MNNLILEWQDKLTSILFEDKNVSGSDISDAINNQYCVLIKYDDETKKHQTGARLIEPFVYGLSSAGNEVIRAFQYYGATRRGVPKYKMFRTDRILSWVPKKDLHFFAEPKKLAQTNISYNENGDKSMNMIFAQVKFSNDENQQQEVQPTREWESPLDRVRREKQNAQQNIEKQINNTINTNPQGAVKTKSLEKSLSQKTSDFEQDVNNRLGISNTSNNDRGAVKIGNNRYDSDAKSQEEKHDNEVMRRRDRRWEKAADERPLWRKGSDNETLQQIDDLE